MVHIKKQDGFTLMEVLLAVVIIGVLAALIGPNIMKRIKQMNINATKATMASLQSAIREYKQEVGQFPKTLDDLIEKPSGKAEKFWDGPYLDKPQIPIDSWKNEYEYNIPPVRFKDYKYYEIISFGDDGMESENDLHVGD